MTLYEIISPAIDDKSDILNNPLEPIIEFRVPGIICPYCGQTWSGSRRTRVEIKDVSMQKRLYRPRPIQFEDWQELKRELVEGSGMTTHPMPGDILGFPKYKKTKDVPLRVDFVHMTHGFLLIRKSAALVLDEAGIKGWEGLPVIIEDRGGLISEESENYYEVNIIEQVLQRGFEEGQMTCGYCKRNKANIIEGLEVAHQFDNSKYMFNVNMNPNRVFCTNDTQKVIQYSRMSNIAFKYAPFKIERLN